MSKKVYSDPLFVDEYEVSISSNPWNAFYERPAALSLLPEAKDLNILDAGCGPGFASKHFLDLGAIVTAVDYSPEMIERTKSRTENRCKAMVLDLSQIEGIFQESEFDVIFSSLVIHYIDDLKKLFQEYSRILKPNGLFLFSTDHPRSPEFGKNGIQKKKLEKVEWVAFRIEMDIYVRPWEEISKALKSNNFVIEKKLEPIPHKTCKNHYPKEYEYLSNNPHFICLKTRNAKTN